MIKYAHTNIVCRDWQVLSDFYIHTFDCRLKPPVRSQSGEWLSKGTGVQNAKLNGVHLLLPGYGEHGPTLEIFEYDAMEEQEAISPKKRGFAHIAFEVDNVQEVLIQLETNGGQRNGQISQHKVEGVGTITFVYARDPEGNLIEIQHWDRAFTK